MEKQKTFNFAISKSLDDRLRAYAEDRGMTLASVVKFALVNLFKETNE